LVTIPFPKQVSSFCNSIPKLQAKFHCILAEFSGHKTLDVILLCLQIETVLFKSETENFIVKVTKNPEEIQALLEVGFEFVCQKEGLMFFRKRK